MANAARRSLDDWSRRIFSVNGAGIVAAWLLHQLSYWMPALDSIATANTPIGTPISGWVAVSAIQLLIHPIALLAEPSILVLVPIILIANLVACVAPLIYVSAGEDSWFASPILLAGSVSGLLLPKSLTGNVFAGYYVWIGSLVILGFWFAVVGLTDDT